MMLLLTLVINLLLWLPIGLLLVEHVSYWQRKEYRWDRMRVGLAAGEFKQAIQVWLAASVLIALALITRLWWLALLGSGTLLIKFGRDAIVKGVMRPKMTHKAILLLLLSGMACGLLVIMFWTGSTKIWLSASWLVIIAPLLILVLVGFVNKLSAWRKHQIIEKAKQLRSSLTQLTVIGVTGSYGKTSTKHFISQLLPTAKVTKEHRNSDYVVAKDMLEQLSDKSSRYVVEMSAYKKGEIADIAQITKPQVGILTHIGNQHLALFGSRQNILEAKWELIEALPAQGVAVLNADDNLIRERANQHLGRVVWYSFNKPADVYATNVDIAATEIKFDLHIGDQTELVRVNLCSEANLSSLLAAAAGVWAAGVAAADIFNRVKKLTSFPRTMELVRGNKGELIIDDSYSANEQSVLNAVKHLGRFSQQDKRIIMVPLIELGKESRKVHQNLGRVLRDAGAKVFVYGSAWQNEIGFQSYNDPTKFVTAALTNITSQTVILLEGRVPAIIRRKLGLKSP